jgi:hypothetical protein
VVDTKAVFNYSSSFLAADPWGCFVYVNEDAGFYIGDGSFRSYRVDATSGSLTLASEAPMKGLGVHHVRTLAASAGRLYFGGDYWWGTSNWDNVLGVLAVSGSGVLSDGKTLISDWDDTGSFRELLAVEAEQDFVLAGYRWDYDLHALAVDVPPAGSPRYRRGTPRAPRGRGRSGAPCHDLHRGLGTGLHRRGRRSSLLRPAPGGGPVRRTRRRARRK